MLSTSCNPSENASQICWSSINIYWVVWTRSSMFKLSATWRKCHHQDSSFKIFETTQPFCLCWVSELIEKCFFLFVHRQHRHVTHLTVAPLNKTSLICGVWGWFSTWDEVDKLPILLMVNYVLSHILSKEHVCNAPACVYHSPVRQETVIGCDRPIGLNKFHLLRSFKVVMDYPQPPVKRRNGISLAPCGSLASTIGLRSVLFELSWNKKWFCLKIIGKCWHLSGLSYPHSLQTWQ